MKHLRTGWITAIPLVALPLWGCQQGSGSETHASSAQVEAVDGGELSRITLSEAAAERLGIETTSVTRADGPGSAVAAVPYSALIYDASGSTWVYVSPAPLTFVRQSVSIASIDGDVAYLTAGPSAGTQVVSVGAAELFGTEQDVGARSAEPRSTPGQSSSPLHDIEEPPHARSA